MADKYGDEDDYDPTEEDEQDDSSVEDVGPITKKKIAVKGAADDEDIEDIEIDEDEDDDEDDELEDGDLEDEEDEADIEGKNIVKNTFSHFDEIEDDESDEDDEEDRSYLQKFDENVKKNIIADWHPELTAHNYDEVEVLSRVVRNEDGVIIDPLHKTLPFITRYETARILGERAKQINAGAATMIEVDASIIDGYLIAMEEYKQKKIPFIIRRPLPNGGIEFWKFEDLEILAL
jgi:DNA-directed RNA polymerase subunit K/omega